MAKVGHFLFIFCLWGVFAMSSVNSFSLDINEYFKGPLGEILDTAICQHESIFVDVKSAQSLRSTAVFRDDDEEIATTTAQVSGSCKTLHNPTRFQFKITGLIRREEDEFQSVRSEILATFSLNPETVIKSAEPAVCQLKFPFSLPSTVTIVDYCKVLRISQNETIVKCERPTDSCNSYIREFKLDQHFKKWVKAFGVGLVELELSVQQLCDLGITVQFQRTLQCAQKMESQTKHTNGHFKEDESSDLHFSKEEL